MEVTGIAMAPSRDTGDDGALTAKQ
jgi:hypothetical protein